MSDGSVRSRPRRSRTQHPVTIAPPHRRSPTTQPRAVRPVLLLVVYGMFLVVVGITASAQAALVSAHFLAAAKSAVVSSDGSIVRAFADEGLTTADLGPGATAARTAQLDGQISRLAEGAGITRLEIRDPSGVVRVATDATAQGLSAAPSSSFTAALSGKVEIEVVGPDQAIGSAGAVPLDLPAGSSAIRAYLPLVDGDGATRAVAVIWRDAEPILAPLATMQRDIVLVTLGAAGIAALLLFLVFRAAQDRISRQAEQLLESTRRDPLTGLLNHGALVAELVETFEHSRATGVAIGVALVDLDNFRLLNDTYGHGSGDVALLTLVRELEQHLPDGAIRGRYGPDEFLVIVDAPHIADLVPALESLRQGLVDRSLQFEESERLPITVSAGIASSPQDATSATGLLATVTQALGEAKAGGGDRVRVATRLVPSASVGGFDVLQGLVFAIDTKDHYTKLHSEDVARYSVFLAQRLGLDAATVDTVRTAGLLHDVGKIGIPEAVLRKPGRLTREEYEIVKQHVAFGESIVHGLVEYDVIRRAIRHHHERWDGRGYLDALAGEDIPLIARILAVGDAFSAMTTDRPYRKALDVREALIRIGDAAGTQLDERFAITFIEGIERDRAAPLPGARARISPWLPQHRAA